MNSRCKLKYNGSCLQFWIQALLVLFGVHYEEKVGGAPTFKEGDISIQEGAGICLENRPDGALKVITYLVF